MNAKLKSNVTSREGAADWPAPALKEITKNKYNTDACPSTAYCAGLNGIMGAGRADVGVVKLLMPQ